MDKKCEFAAISYDKGQIYNANFQDVYHQEQHGFAESDYVFIEGNQLLSRFRKLKDQTFTIGEIGFGTGLNFINTAKHFLNTAANTAKLTYISCEKYPLPLTALKDIQSTWPLEALRQQLYQQYPYNHGGYHLLQLQDNIQLLLLLGEANCLLPQCMASIDAWFLDGFSPKKNPDLWSTSLLKSMASLSHKSTTLATFSSSAIIKHNLSQCGFSYQKMPGYAKKREIIFARYCHDNQQTAHWSNPPKRYISHKQPIAVVGAGIAGAATAYQLALSGRQIHIYDDPQSTPASDVPLAVPFFLPGKTPSPLRLFQSLALHDAIRTLHTLNHRDSNLLSEMPLHLIFADNYASHKKNIFAEMFNDDFCVTDKHQSTFKGLGAINLPLLCRLLYSHKNISYFPNKVNTLVFDRQQWRINHRDNYQAVVLATGYQQQLLPEIYQNRLRPIRGQSNIYHCHPPIKQAINCGTFSVIPYPDCQHVYIGGTYQTNHSEMASSDEDDKALLSALKSALPNHQFSKVDDFVGIRSASSDYLPMIGPLAPAENIFKHYHKWQQDSRLPIHKNLNFYPGLFMHQGLGSKGTLTAFLAAKIISAMINQTALPIPASLLPSIMPARFVIRDIKRRQFSL